MVVKIEVFFLVLNKMYKILTLHSKTGYTDHFYLNQFIISMN